MTAPLVSVYLPTRDRASLVAQAVRSVLSQEHRELELLVVDDASVDATPDVLERLAREDSRVRVFRQPASRGAPAARNVAIAAAHGEFITGLDDDDAMLPARVRLLLAAWHDEHAFVCSAFFQVGHGWRRPVGTRPARVTLDELLHGNVIGNQVLTRTARLRELGGFDEGLSASQDYDLWTRLVHRFGPALRVPEPTMLVRVSSANRISGSHAAVVGARQYRAKHVGAMRPEHLRSQRLVEVAAGRGRLRLADLAACWTPSNAATVMRYWAISNVPGAESLRDWLWRLRWPDADALPAGADCVGSHRPGSGRT